MVGVVGLRLPLEEAESRGPPLGEPAGGQDTTRIAGGEEIGLKHTLLGVNSHLDETIAMPLWQLNRDEGRGARFGFK